MIQLPHGNWCSEIKVVPEDWDKLTGELGKQPVDWYVYYRFYSPDYPKGKLVIKKRMNVYKTLAERKSSTKRTIADLKELLLVDGYNPILKKVIPVDTGYEIDPKTKVVPALTAALARLKVAASTRRDIKNVLPHIEKSILSLSYDRMSILPPLGKLS